MLSRKTQFSVGDAKKYFREDLCVGDYYTGGQQVPGRWFGKGAEDLGLSRPTHGEELVRLCENIHPLTGERLTLRQKTTRTKVRPDDTQHEIDNRRGFDDFTFKTVFISCRNYTPPGWISPRLQADARSQQHKK
jgi:hypothetical protein